MKKIGIIISIIIIYFFIYFLQTNFFCWFTINGVQPNLFILLALFIGIFMGRKTGTILGVLFGLYTDFLYSNTIGISGILFGAIGFIGDYLDKKFSKDSKIISLKRSSSSHLNQISAPSARNGRYSRSWRVCVRRCFLWLAFLFHGLQKLM